MVVVAPGPAPLDTKAVACWHASDSLLGNQPVVVFVGPSVVTNVTQSSSRIQAHVFSIAGFLSFPRLTINPTSDVYAAVNRLPDEAQGDETRRALAVGLYKYYLSMPKAVKQNILDRWMGATEVGLQPRIFDDYHAAALASRMVKVRDADAVSECIQAAMAERSVSWLDVDVVLPAESITVVPPKVPDGRASLVPLPDLRPLIDYGRYSTLLDLLGESTFLPTSRLRRAPSRPTAISRTRVLDEAKKKSLLRELQELVGTELSYVNKLKSLVDSPAACSAVSIRDRTLQRLFPPSLREILFLNEEFLERIRAADPEEASDRSASAVLSFSKIMLEYFPKFKGPYQDYLRASGQFSKLLTELSRDKDSPCALAIQNTGEQRLRSWLIEPVQRLPRYSLFIDNMANMLPADHPAMSRFLAARDIVTDICALESEGAENNPRIVERLRRMVQGWSHSFEPSGRLVAAVDCNELQAPFAPNEFSRSGTPNVLLVFPDTVVVAEKIGSVAARGILAEVDRAPSAPTLMDAMPGGAAAQAPFAFRLAISLTNTRLTESCDSRLLHIAYSRALREERGSNGPSQGHATLVFQLMGAYERKAYKLNEEIAMARIEHRYPEEIRESPQWALKSAQSPSDELGLLCAVSSAKELIQASALKLPLGRTRVVMDNCLERLPPKLASSLFDGVECVVNVNLLAEDRFSVEVSSQGRHVSVDTVSEEEFLTCLTKRLAYVQRLLHRPADIETAQQYIVHSRNLAAALEPLLNVDDQFVPELLPTHTESRRHRPLSPVKGFSSFLGGGSREGGTSPTKKFGLRGRADTAKSAAAPPVLAASQPTDRPISHYDSSRSQGTLESYQQRYTTRDPTKQVVDTFDSFIVAIRSRKGNIVGRTLQNRHYADETAVNELYNILIQDPSQYQSAAEVSVDVLFAAFEKFLKNAWKSRLGPILPMPTLYAIQELLFSDAPGTTQKFKLMLNDMTPENKRAFTTMISVLSELVGATGNDGDRGVLVVTFSEALIDGGNPADQVMLFDRFLADADLLFGIKPPEPAPEQRDPDRARATGTGSIGSAASSLGKKLGWWSSIGRSNSKNGEGESKVNQLLRHYSKRSNAEPDSTPPSLSRSFLSRTRSTDTRPTTPGSPSLSRPGSSYSNQGQDTSRPGSAHGLLTSLEPINEQKTARPHQLPPKKKRRSSLSDLPNARLGDIRPLNPASPPSRNKTIGGVVTPPDQKPPATGRQSVRQKSPTSASVLSRGRPQSTYTKENTPTVLYERNHNRQESRINAGPNRIRATKSPTPLSAIPIARSDLPQILQTPHLSPTKNAQVPGLQKLRIQSPQRLGERIDREKRAMAEAGTSLQAGIDGIGRELADNQVSDTNSAPRALAARVSEMEQLLTSRLDALGAQADAIQADLESSLLVSETKSKNLDALYRQASVENEMMYDRFNGELEKVLKKVTAGPGLDEMRRQLKAAQDESQRLRKDNQRLKRENLGLRSQLRDG